MTFQTVTKSKWFILLIALVLCATGWGGAAYPQPAYADTVSVVADSFDGWSQSQLEAAYTLFPNPQTAQNRVVIAPAPGRSGDAMYLHDAAASQQTQASRTLAEPLRGTVTVELDWYHEGSSRSSSLRPLKLFSSPQESSGTTIAEIQTRDGGNDLALTVDGAHYVLLADYPLNTWHQLKLVLHTATKKVSAYVNGVLIAQQIDLPANASNGLVRLKAYSQNSPTIGQYLDNLLVYTGDAGPAPSPTAGPTGTPAPTGSPAPTATATPTPPATASPNPAAGDLFVAPNGSAAQPGTLQSPTTLTEAIARIQPGRTIYMRGGVYSFTETVMIARGNNGTAGSRKQLYAYGSEKPVLDFYGQAFDPANRGLTVNGHYWHIKGLEVRGAGDNGIFIGGNYNRIENVETHHNKDSGLQISRHSAGAPRAEWPSYNEIINVFSHNNYDPDNGEDADGFAAKLTTGPGNVFTGCIAAYNVDDGWDLYTKGDTGPIDPVTIRDSIAYRNGATQDGTSTSNSDGNGFKLGGSGIQVNHIIENNIAFQNKKHGFTYNSNPGSIVMTNNTSWDNGKQSGSNFAFDQGTHIFKNNLSYKASSSDKYPNVNDVAQSNVWWHNSKGSLNGKGLLASDSDFVSLTPTVGRNSDGSPAIGNFLRLAAGSDLIGAGTPAGVSIGALESTAGGAGGATPVPPASSAAPGPTSAPTPALTATPAPSAAPTAASTAVPGIGSVLNSVSGFAAAGGTTGGGVISESSPLYRKVTNATELGLALKRNSGVKVVEIMNDLSLGWNEIEAAARTAPIREHNAASTHPVLLQTGVSKIEIDGFNGLTIFSRNGAAVKHAALVIKRSSNVVIRNLEFDELWEWDEQSKGDYDKNDWDYITLEETHNVWIDHSTFRKAYDGVVDVKKGSSGVTVSWSLFTGDDLGPNSWLMRQMDALEANRSAYPMYNELRNLGLSKADIAAVSAGQKKGHLIGANELRAENNGHTVTLHHNYYKDMMDRMPRLRGGNVHVYNVVMDSADANAASQRISAAQKTAIESKGYKFGVTSNGAISTENGAVLLENSHIIDVLYPLRNNQKNASQAAYTGKIKALNTIYSMNGVVFKGGSETPGSPLSPVPAAAPAFSWNGFSALPYSYSPDAPEALTGKLLAGNGAGAGKLSGTVAQWLNT